MKAIGFTEAGGPEVLHELELPDPIPGPNQLRVRVLAADVNPSDALIRGKAEVDPAHPKVLGWDFAGILEEIGPGADTDLVVGDRVMGITVPSEGHGAYAEQVVASAASVVRLPAGVDEVAASTLPMNGLTACLMLDTLALAPGSTLAVTGAAGAVGGYVVQLAKVRGIRVIADAAPGDRQLVESLGADVVVERGPAVVDRIRAVAPDGVETLIDTAVLNDKVVGAVRDGGRILTARPFDGDPVRGITWLYVQVSDYARQRATLDELRRLVEAGSVTLRVAATFPAAEASKAHRLIEQGGIRGRLVLTFSR